MPEAKGYTLNSLLSSDWPWLRNVSTSATLAKGEEYRVRSFIQKYPNLYFDILQSGSGSVFPPGQTFGVREAVLYEQGQGPPVLRAEWKKLFGDHPDRFLIGSDVNKGRWKTTTM